MASHKQEENCQSAAIRSICSAHALAHVSRLDLAAQSWHPAAMLTGAGKSPAGRKVPGWEDQPSQWLSIHTGMKQR